jgi:hypothetical protein
MPIGISTNHFADPPAAGRDAGEFICSKMNYAGSLTVKTGASYPHLFWSARMGMLYLK